MTNQSERKTKDNSFSSFAIGVSVGVAASLLFGTDEGRKFVKKIVDVIPDKYKVFPKSPLNVAPTPHSVAPLLPLQETQHHTTYEYLSTTTQNSPGRRETPPPPAPVVRPSRPELFQPTKS